MQTPTRFVAPAELHLDHIRWHRIGAVVKGRVGDAEFQLDLPTATVLDRRKLIQSVWRFRQLLGIVPSIEAYRAMIEDAEREAATW